MKTVRDGQIVWPYCSDCGCRLEMLKGQDDNFYFRHYEGALTVFLDSFVFLDARGCMCTNRVWALEERILYQGVV